MFLAEDGEIRERGGQGGYTNNGAQNNADHRNPTAALNQSVEHLTCTCEGINAVLSTLASAVPHGDERGLGTFSHFDDLGDFQGVHFAHASTVDAEILSKAVDTAPLNGALPCNDAVAKRLMQEHVVVVGAVGDEGVNLQK